jgi:hypothetical protein
VIRQRDETGGQMRAQTHVVEADYTSAEGRTLLEQHSPPVTWKGRSSGMTILFAIALVLAPVTALLVIGIAKTGARVGFEILPLFGAAMALHCRRMNRPIELVLSAGASPTPRGCGRCVSPTWKR